MDERLPDWATDITDVFRHGWNLVLLVTLLAGLAGAGVDVGRGVRSTHGNWHWPAWYWIVLIVLSLLFAQHRVIGERRRGRHGTDPAVKRLQVLIDTAHELECRNFDRPGPPANVLELADEWERNAGSTLASMGSRYPETFRDRHKPLPSLRATDAGSAPVAEWILRSGRASLEAIQREVANARWTQVDKRENERERLLADGGLLLAILDRLGIIHSQSQNEGLAVPQMATDEITALEVWASLVHRFLRKSTPVPQWRLPQRDTWGPADDEAAFKIVAGMLRRVEDDAPSWKGG